MKKLDYSNLFRLKAKLVNYENDWYFQKFTDKEWQKKKLKIFEEVEGVRSDQ